MTFHHNSDKSPASPAESRRLGFVINRSSQNAQRAETPVSCRPGIISPGKAHRGIYHSIWPATPRPTHLTPLLKK